MKPTKPLGVPVWSHDGIVCTGETYQKVVKLTFMCGGRACGPDGSCSTPASDGGTRRAIDIPDAEARACRSGMGEIARFLGAELAAVDARRPVARRAVG